MKAKRPRQMPSQNRRKKSDWPTALDSRTFHIPCLLRSKVIDVLGYLVTLKNKSVAFDSGIVHAFFGFGYDTPLHALSFSSSSIALNLHSFSTPIP